MDSENEFKHSYMMESVMVSAGDDIGSDTVDNSDDSDGNKSCKPLREQDRFLPIANVAKIMKRAIPENGKIAKDARECVQECVSEFISFITSEASDRCHMEKRKTINGEDILFAMSSLGFDNYVDPLKLYLQKYRETTKMDKNTPSTPPPQTTFEIIALNDDYSKNRRASIRKSPEIPKMPNSLADNTQNNQRKTEIFDPSVSNTVLYYQSDHQQFQL
ncbi:nuclear transcription factor Y subunit beta isoform X1 [Phlebotomus papatasi]|uniref:nuclear transcription factor Y subunit beta isoform X1 n=1 Tax=Phlebotomus papatasi TaxID=29031 RepID=UPI0024838CBD|nr:nuclear transcription factor Y subunit beta isoform X1 [Phlebotomus papatasi]